MLLLMTFPFVEFTLVEGFLVGFLYGNPPIFTPIPRVLHHDLSMYRGRSSRQIWVEITFYDHR